MKKIKKLLLCGAICTLSLCCAVPISADKNRDLREAAACGDLYGVKRLIKEGAYVNSKNYDDETPLILALKNNHEDVVKYLVENVEGVKCCGAEPMNIAYEKWGLPMMEYLANHGIGTITNADLKFKSAVLAGHYPKARFLFKHYNSAISLLQPNRIISFLEKEETGTYDFCKLIDEGFIKLDSTLYTIAYCKGYEKVCTKLKEYCGNTVKLDLNSVKESKHYREFEKKIIERAILYKEKEALEELNTNGIDNEKMVSAISKLISEKSMLSEKNIPFSEKKKLLCEKEKLIYEKEKLIYGRTTDPEDITKLIDMGENKEQVNKILVTAIKNDELNIVELFINSKFDINSRINYGDTALILASREGKTEIVKFLVNNGADVNIKTACGNTALIVASQWGSAKIVKILIDNGADVNVKNNDKRTALDLAKKYVKKKWVHNKEDYIEIIQLLESFQPAKTTTKKSIFSRLFSKDKKTNKPTTITKNEEPIFQEPIFTPQPNAPVVPTFQNNNSSNINKNFNTLNNNSATKDLFDGIEDDSFFDVLKAIKNGANVNAVNPEDGMTPLMLAAVNGQLEIIKFLIQNHANVNEVFNNKTALKMAKNERIRQELINAGATI